MIMKTVYRTISSKERDIHKNSTCFSAENGLLYLVNLISIKFAPPESAIIFRCFKALPCPFPPEFRNFHVLWRSFAAVYRPHAELRCEYKNAI